MIIWLNAQLPPAIAAWITATFGITTGQRLVEIAGN